MMTVAVPPPPPRRWTDAVRWTSRGLGRQHRGGGGASLGGPIGHGASERRSLAESPSHANFTD